jgi:nitroreductase
MPAPAPTVPLEFTHRPAGELAARARAFYDDMRRRRTVRTFAPTPVPQSVIADAIRAAGTAPSGAHKQPWHFAAVGSADVKARIRQAAEAEEQAFYGGRASDQWLDDLAPFGTDAHKPFLEIAPWLIAVFARPFDLDEQGERHKNYYVSESVCIACGLLIAALHHAGLATLTHTPSPMKFLAEALGRPAHERAVVLIVAGYPAESTRVPDLTRKPLDQIASWH